MDRFDRGVKMIRLVAVLLLLLIIIITPRIQGWATAPEEATGGDLVPVVPPRERVPVAIPGGGGGGAGMRAAPLCLQCWCCSRSSPRKCEVTGCCSTFNCDPAGKCNFVPLRCDCNGCGGN